MTDGDIVEAEQYALAFAAFGLSAALEQSGLTQRALAERVGVTEARISHVLNAEGNMTIKTLARLAAALDCRLQVRFVSPLDGKEREAPEVIRDAADVSG